MLRLGRDGQLPSPQARKAARGRHAAEVSGSEPSETSVLWENLAAGGGSRARRDVLPEVGSFDTTFQGNGHQTEQQIFCAGGRKGSISSVQKFAVGDRKGSGDPTLEVGVDDQLS